MPPRFRGSHSGLRAQYMGSPEARRMGAGRELFGVRQDGSEFPIEIGLNPLVTDEGRFVLSAIVDISERTRQANETLHLANEALRRANAELERGMARLPNSVVLSDRVVSWDIGYLRGRDVILVDDVTNTGTTLRYQVDHLRGAVGPSGSVRTVIGYVDRDHTSPTLLHDLNVEPSIGLVDGSGLSRRNLLTPAALHKLLRYAYDSPYRDLWMGLLPVGGEDGTLKNAVGDSRRTRSTTASGSAQSAFRMLQPPKVSGPSRPCFSA